jgi:RNA polymerase sigma-70 factor (ECF subfamily)
MIAFITPVMADEKDEFLPTRLSLLARLKDWGDQESWQECFDTYHRLIHSVALRAGLEQAEAQDVVQETVLTVAKRIGAFRADPERGSFKAWLLVITRRRIADQFEKRASQLPSSGGPAQTCPVAGGSAAREEGGDDSGTATVHRIPDPVSVEWGACWDEQWRKHVFDTALTRVRGKVSPLQFQMFDLYVLREWPVMRVARTLGVSSASVYLAKHRVAAALRTEAARLKREWENA